jgi:hypothetical protein
MKSKVAARGKRGKGKMERDNKKTNTGTITE